MAALLRSSRLSKLGKNSDCFVSVCSVERARNSYHMWTQSTWTKARSRAKPSSRQWVESNSSSSNNSNRNNSNSSSIGDDHNFGDGNDYLGIDYISAKNNKTFNFLIMSTGSK